MPWVREILPKMMTFKSKPEKRIGVGQLKREAKSVPDYTKASRKVLRNVS